MEIQNAVKAKFVLDAPTTEYFARILTILIELINQYVYLEYKTREVLFNWLETICRTINERLNSNWKPHNIILLQKALLLLVVLNDFTGKYLYFILNDFFNFRISKIFQNNKRNFCSIECFFGFKKRYGIL